MRACSSLPALMLLRLHDSDEKMKKARQNRMALLFLKFWICWWAPTISMC